MTVTADFEPSEGHVSGACDGGDMEALVELWRRVDELNELPLASGSNGPRALAAAQAIARVRHAADALLAPYAARLDALSDPAEHVRFARWKGYPNAAALLSAFTGLSPAEAGKLISVGKALADADAAQSAPPALAVVPDDGVIDLGDAPEVSGEVPALSLVAAAGEADAGGGVGAGGVGAGAPWVSPLAAAIRSGALGTEKANIIRRTLEDMVIDTREVEAFLVERAQGLTIRKVRRLCFDTFAERDPQGYALREKRQHRERYVKFHEEADGMIGISGKLDPATAAPIKAWMEAELEAEVFAQRDRRVEERRTIGQIFADVLVTTCRHAMGCNRATTRPKTTVVVRASQEAARSGDGIARCDGIEAPLTIGTALAMAVDSEVATLVQGTNGEPLALGRAKRSATSAQRLAVAERDQGCAKCERALSKCDAHHVIEWSRGGRTDAKNLVMLCISCHHIVHDEAWGVVVENNQVWFIPPASVDPHRRRQPGSSARRAA